VNYNAPVATTASVVYRTMSERQCWLLMNWSTYSSSCRCLDDGQSQQPVLMACNHHHHNALMRLIYHCYDRRHRSIVVPWRAAAAILVSIQVRAQVACTLNDRTGLYLYDTVPESVLWISSRQLNISSLQLLADNEAVVCCCCNWLTALTGVFYCSFTFI